ncbi:unnamed protein product [Protopolystoma xenopodis]|uniref:Uncharacterized protein n=1 Tax=Protopolystoma xenopodis TaxID=117903 RepID=A0A3S5FCB2_9PLAT|nr:unnamed protein product [Protopolystoma xenopodis]
MAIHSLASGRTLAGAYRRFIPLLLFIPNLLDFQPSDEFFSALTFDEPCDVLEEPNHSIFPVVDSGFQTFATNLASSLIFQNYYEAKKCVYLLSFFDRLMHVLLLLLSLSLLVQQLVEWHLKTHHSTSSAERTRKNSASETRGKSTTSNLGNLERSMTMVLDETTKRLYSKEKQQEAIYPVITFCNINPVRFGHNFADVVDPLTLRPSKSKDVDQELDQDLALGNGSGSDLMTTNNSKMIDCRLYLLHQLAILINITM